MCFIANIFISIAYTHFVDKPDFDCWVVILQRIYDFSLTVCFSLFCQTPLPKCRYRPWDHVRDTDAIGGGRHLHLPKPRGAFQFLAGGIVGDSGGVPGSTWLACVCLAESRWRHDAGSDRRTHRLLRHRRRTPGRWSASSRRPGRERSSTRTVRSAGLAGLAKLVGLVYLARERSGHSTVDGHHRSCCSR